MSDDASSASLAESLAAGLSAAGVDPSSELPIATGAEKPPVSTTDENIANYDPLAYATSRFTSAPADSASSAAPSTRRTDPLVQQAAELNEPSIQKLQRQAAAQTAESETEGDGEEGGETEQEPDAGDGSADAHRQAIERYKEVSGHDLTAKYANDEEFFKGIAHLSRLMGQRNELAELGRVAMEQPEKVLQLYKQKGILKDPEPGKPEPGKTEPAQAGGASAIPDGFKSEWLPYLEKGRIAADTPNNIRAEIDDYFTTRQILANPAVRALQNKISALESALNGKPQGDDQRQYVDQRLADQQAAVWAEKIVDQYEDRIFKSVNGRRELAPEGFVFRNALQEATGWNAPPDKALEYALREMDRSARPSQAAVSSSGKPKRNGAAHKPNVSPAKSDGSEDVAKILESTGGNLGDAIRMRLGLPQTA